MATKSVTAADKAIGQRIRAARLAARISQEKLAEALDVSFQQVQKYEKGSNRVGSARLVTIATALNVPVMQLLGADETPASTATLTLMTTREGQALAAAFNRLDAPELRRSIVNVVQLMADMSSFGVDATVAGAIKLMQAAE